MTNVLIKKAKQKYGISDSDCNKILVEINNALDSILKSDLKAYGKLSDEPGLERKAQILSKEGKAELKKVFKDKIYVTNIVNSGSNALVDDIFIEPELLLVRGHYSDGMKLNYENLFNCRNRQEEMPLFLLIEGPPGSGKSTLTKKIISDFLKENEGKNALQQYHLLFFENGRTGGIHSLKSLMEVTLRNTCAKTQIDPMVHLSFLKILIIIDGLDEIDNSVVMFLKDIFKLMSISSSIHILITTRPEKTKFLYGIIPGTIEICHLQLHGISLDRRTEFILKYSSTLMTFGVETLKSSTRLYNETVNMILAKLADRLCAESQTISSNKFLGEFMKVLCRASLSDFSRGQICVSEENIMNIKAACDQLHLPTDDVLHSFFKVTENIGSNGYQDFKYEYLHRGLQEFLAASAIHDCLKQSNKKKLIRNVKSDVRRALETHNVPVSVSGEILESLSKMMREKIDRNPSVVNILKDLHNEDLKCHIGKYQNILAHLSCLIVRGDPDMIDSIIAEVVNLLKDHKLYSSEEWLNIVEESDFNCLVLSEIMKIIPRNHLVVRDGHLKAASLILQKIDQVDSIEMHISGDPQKLPELMDVLQTLSDKNTLMRLILIHHWRYPEQGSSDKYIKAVVPHQMTTR
ncbi:hypothetical protein SK128_009494 [Halocaridina rubra]|uniref:NACHT domain-containing protein n=1 Tax=Halocaridina rubra TaxID=373956 RepID=A0AAN8WDV7_HALRR